MTERKNPADPPAEEDRPFTPPASGRLIGLALLLAMAAGALLMVSRVPSTAAPSSPEPAAAAGHPVQGGVPGQTGGLGPVEAERAPPPAPPGPSVVRRCVIGGQTLFTDMPCPQGARSEELALPVSAPAATGPTSVTLYRCRNHEGGHFWSRTHCHRQASQVDRVTTVPGDLTLAQQVRLAEQRRLALAPAATPVPARSTRAVDPVQASPGRGRCDQIEKRIARIDSEARQPLSGRQQDRLRAERQDLRQEQFALRCS